MFEAEVDGILVGRDVAAFHRFEVALQLLRWAFIGLNLLRPKLFSFVDVVAVFGVVFGVCVVFARKF